MREMCCCGLLVGHRYHIKGHGHFTYELPEGDYTIRAFDSIPTFKAVEVEGWHSIGDYDWTEVKGYHYKPLQKIRKGDRVKIVTGLECLFRGAAWYVVAVHINVAWIQLEDHPTENRFEHVMNLEKQE